jgi:ATP-dependent protease Clp ATPase subunit
MSDDAKPSCSFCGKSQDEVLILIAGQRAHICEECVATSVDMLKEKGVWPSAPVRLLRAIRHRFAGRRESN